MTERVECVVVGAGVVGLAVARAIALAGHEVVIADQADSFGTGVSARNSEVIHAGLYYPKDSLKARFCLRGRHMLRDYLVARRVEHRFVGKLVVATDDAEADRLSALCATARANGVDDATVIPADAARAMEPELSCTAALHSPSTGILDVHGLMLAMLGDAEEAGALFSPMSRVTGGAVDDGGVVLFLDGAEEPLACRTLVNAAGLGAQGLARALDGFPTAAVPPLHLCKGNYFLLSGHTPFSRLVYPVPQEAGLGTHFTLDLAGQGRFGPDVEWIGDEEYDVDLTRADVFYPAIRRYWPALPDGALRPGYAGIRPKLQAKGQAARDFAIEGTSTHGVPGIVNLFGIESPGLTACLAIGRAVAEMLE